jgi:hypothetical protein
MSENPEGVLRAIDKNEVIFASCEDDLLKQFFIDKNRVSA